MFKFPLHSANRSSASKWPTAALLLAALMVAAPLTTAPAHAQNQQEPATITISGQGKISLAPDMGVVTTRVVTPAKTAPEALSMNTEAMNKVIADIKAAGIEARDIQTNGFSIFPRYADRRNEPDQPLKIIGYQVSNGVTVNIRDLSKLGSVLDTVVRSGANEINGINFQVSNADKMLDTARKAAVANAKAKAELYAEAAGVKLGRILSISEAGTAAPRPYAMRAEKMMMNSAPVPIQAGEETLSSNITIVWELVQ
ncbi:SIMPL domain-containing protein [Roseibium algae]|uniref:SIMPL domain-containing protein n=1 Tax=Roseibium algae TaxID=3123038 RepID=A0ABU8TEK8_9HYPH